MSGETRDPTRDPEVKAVAAIVVALEGIDEAAQKRVLEWAIDRYVRQPGRQL